uniref:Uncharacterized protein n=1 Tax=Arundo donax TaxID=35708 RepID=A0A0A9AH04_ARUDO
MSSLSMRSSRCTPDSATRRRCGACSTGAPGSPTWSLGTR